MNTAIDTSVLIAITKGEPRGAEWVELLADKRTSGDLVICDIVAAEFFALTLNPDNFQEALSNLGIEFSPVGLSASQLAGRIFRRYRDEGGPREYLIPDFFIAAHASIQAGQIAAIDRGYLRRYFPKLKVLAL